jgi:hypothetical protein
MKNKTIIYSQEPYRAGRTIFFLSLGFIPMLALLYGVRKMYAQSFLNSFCLIIDGVIVAATAVAVFCFFYAFWGIVLGTTSGAWKQYSADYNNETVEKLRKFVEAERM